MLTRFVQYVTILKTGDFMNNSINKMNRQMYLMRGFRMGLLSAVHLW